ncbi:MAG: hydroxypyruvate reductase [Synoicihabitans sp.]
MKTWKNTSTLDGYIDDLVTLVPPEEAEIALIGGKPIDLDSMPNLRGILKCGIGKDNLPEEQAANRGIEARIASRETSDIIFEETANFACKLIFDLAYAAAGDLEGWQKNQRRALLEQRLLVVGHGNIGRRVSHKMGAFMAVDTYDPMANAPEELEPLIRAADFVTLHMPLIPSTRGFIDAEKLSWLKDGACLVNTARGPVVEEASLLNEIQTGRLRAAFDVFWQEPYHGPLREFHPDRFLMTPHISSTCTAFLEGLRKDLQSLINDLKAKQ